MTKTFAVLLLAVTVSTPALATGSKHKPKTPDKPSQSLSVKSSNSNKNFNANRNSNRNANVNRNSNRNSNANRNRNTAYGGAGGSASSSSAASNALSNNIVYSNKAAASGAYAYGSSGQGCGRSVGFGAQVIAFGGSVSIPFDSATDCKLEIARLYGAFGARDRAIGTLDSIPHSPYYRGASQPVYQQPVVTNANVNVNANENRNVSGGRNPCAGSSTTDMIACGNMLR